MLPALTLLALRTQVWNTRRKTGGMPGPGFLWVMRHVADFHAATAKLHQKNGGINLLFMGPRSMVVVSDPDAMKQVHTHNTPVVLPSTGMLTLQAVLARGVACAHRCWVTR